MIHRLEIENFYSIRETQVIDLRIGAKVPDEEGRFAEVKDGSGGRVPKTVAFFGANASGKSNVLKALAFLRWFLVESVKEAPDAMLPFMPFADATGVVSATRIKVDFDWFSDLSNVNLQEMEGLPFAHYSYEVRLLNVPGQGGNVLSEELRSHPILGKSKNIFKRGEDGKVQTSPKYSMNKYGQILAKLRKNASLTSTLAQFSGIFPLSLFWDWAKRIPSNIFLDKVDLLEASIVQHYVEHPDILNRLNEVINKIDFGLSSMSLVQFPTGIGAMFAHKGLDRPLLFQFESEGTKNFVKVFPYIKESLIVGGIAVVDELDSTIHPALLPEILRWFHDPKENPRNAQLWFSGHSASLLEELKKEEIFFTEKDELGRTNIYGLKDIEGVRRVDNFYQKYLGGVYGAVPRIG